MKNYLKHNQTAFTLIEMLVAVLIIAVLAAMAVPMYERTVERSHRAEVSMTLKRLSEAKLRTMTNMELATFSGSPASFTRNQLDTTVANTDDFNYSLYPNSFPNAVCAVRARGPYQGTTFLYLGEAATDSGHCSSCTGVASGTVCGGFCSSGQRLFCQDASGSHSGGCDAYGMNSVSVGTCSTSVF